MSTNSSDKEHDPFASTEASEHYKDARNIDRLLHERAISIRWCLEHISAEIFYVVSNSTVDKEKWSKKTLHDKINAMKNYFSKDIINIF